MSRRLDLNLKAKSDWLEMEPFAVTASADEMRPVMLFRVVGGEDVLPVWLSPIDAGIALTQHQGRVAPISPHDLSLKVLETLGVRLERCLFSEVKGHHQYVELQFSGSRKLKSLVARADQALSFSLQAKAKFYCRPEYIHESKVVNAEMVGVHNDLKLNPNLSKNRQKYLN